MSIFRIARALPFSGLFSTLSRSNACISAESPPFDGLNETGQAMEKKIIRQLEKEAETVLNVLQPGPLGIIEHKFTAQEIREAKATVCTAVENWRRHSTLEHANGVLNDFIYK